MEVRRLYKQEPGIINHQNDCGMTGLMCSIVFRRNAISRWLLGRPGLDTSISEGKINNRTALHACIAHNCDDQVPLDIVIHLAKLCTKETLNHRDQWGNTALDWALDCDGHTSAALYLTWLGAKCKRGNLMDGSVTLPSWIAAGRQQDAQYWAVAANDSEALARLERMENVQMDWKKLNNLAKLFKNEQMSLAIYHLKNPLLKLYQEPRSSNPDFQIICPGSRPILCHKSFLSARSEMFRAMLEHDTKEAKEMMSELVICKDIEVVENFVRFFYTGQLEKGVNALKADATKLVKHSAEVPNDVLVPNLSKFLELSSFYLVAELKSIVEDRMIESLNENTAEEFLLAADFFNGERVKSAAVSFVKYRRPRLLKENKKLEHMVEQLQDEDWSLECRLLGRMVEKMQL